MSLSELWYIIFLLFISVYTILDGFDLGVGVWTFFVKNGPNGSDRRTLIKSIAPFWDGNEVWLLASGVILFAVFPDVYATIFSGFYIPTILLLFCLIFRAVAIEFRNELSSKLWQRICDIGFMVGSFFPALAYGLIVGNVIGGIPIDSTKNYAGDLLYFFNPYALLIGLLGLIMILTHGAVYLVLRTEGSIALKARNWVKFSWVIYLVLFIVASAYTIILKSELIDTYIQNPILFIVPLGGLGTILLIGFFWQKKADLYAFLASTFSILLLILSAGIGQYPNLVRATDPLNSLTIQNTSSSELGLTILLILITAALLVIIPYTAWVYKVFGGKIEKTSSQSS